MLRDEIKRYTNLTGEDGWHVPIMKICAYLDGYDKGLEVLDKVRAEIDGLLNDEDSNMYAHGVMDCLEIIDKFMAEGSEE